MTDIGLRRGTHLLLRGGSPARGNPTTTLREEQAQRNGTIFAKTSWLPKPHISRYRLPLAGQSYPPCEREVTIIHHAIRTLSSINSVYLVSLIPALGWWVHPHIRKPPLACLKSSATILDRFLRVGAVQHHGFVLTRIWPCYARIRGIKKSLRHTVDYNI